MVSLLVPVRLGPGAGGFSGPVLNSWGCRWADVQVFSLQVQIQVKTSEGNAP